MTEQEDWAPDDEPRQCRRWNKREKRWQWKARYETREQAADRAGKGMALYVCDECGFWHRASAHTAPTEITVHLSDIPVRRTIRIDMEDTPLADWEREAICGTCGSTHGDTPCAPKRETPFR